MNSDVLRALEELGDHPDARYHTEQTPSGGGHSWRCIPIVEAVETCADTLAEERRAGADEERARILIAVRLATDGLIDSDILDAKPSLAELAKHQDALERLVAASDADIACHGCNVYRRGKPSRDIEHSPNCPVQEARALLRREVGE